MTGKNLYEVLGVDKTATDAEIKKKYKKLCIKYHPDKQINKTEDEIKEAEEKFKEVNSAYEILSDKAKREQYDRYGEVGRNFSQDDLANFMREEMRRNGFNMNVNDNNTFKYNGQDIRITIKLSLQEIYEGVSKKIKYKKRCKCRHCNGSGVEEGGHISSCSHCGGTGLYQEYRETGLGYTIIQTQCPYCHGIGEEIVKPCKECSGSGLTIQDVEADIIIPAGCREDITLSINNYGHESIRGLGTNGRLLVNIQNIGDNTYKRINQNDIYVEHITSFANAMLGEDIEIKHISGSIIKCKLPPNTPDGNILKCAKKGMPIMNTNNFGDLLVGIKYQYPSKITKEQKELLTKFLEIEKNKK